MAKGLALAIVLVAIALTYWRPLRHVRTALGIEHLVATGHVFLFVGFLLGLVFGEPHKSLVDDISPVVAFVAGWVGFATGMRFDLRVLRTIPRRAMVVALLPAGGAAAVVGLACAALLWYLGVNRSEAAAAVLVLAAAAASSGPTLVAIIRTRRPGRSALARPVLRLVELSAGLDDILVILLAMLAFAMFRAGPESVSPLWVIAVALGGGSVLGGVTWLFLGGRATEDERLLLGLGMLAFTAGCAGWLYLAPAALTAIMAIVLTNLPGEHMAQLLRAVRRVERPAVVILMTVIGFHLTARMTWIFFPLLLALTALRLLCKRWVGDLLADAVDLPGLRTSRRWGQGLGPQGTLGLVVALSFFHVWRDDLSRTVLGAIAVAGLINEIISPWLYLGLLKSIMCPGRTEKPAGEEVA